MAVSWTYELLVRARYRTTVTRGERGGDASWAQGTCYKKCEVAHCSYLGKSMGKD